MIHVLAILAIASLQDSTTTPYELSERWKQLEVAWMSNSSRADRLSAASKLIEAEAAAKVNRLSDASRLVDEATAMLERRELRSSDALSFRFNPIFVDPGQRARLEVSWSYLPKNNDVVRVTVGARSQTLQPGKNTIIDLETPALNPESSRDPEQAVLVPISAGESRRSAYISILTDVNGEIHAIRESKNVDAMSFLESLELPLNGEAQHDYPWLQIVQMASDLAAGRKKLRDYEEVPTLKYGQSVLRAFVPTSATKECIVVIGLHGQGKTEAMFFEESGRGAPIREAEKRNWVFLAPRLGPNCVEGALKWLADRRGMKPTQLFIFAVDQSQQSMEYTKLLNLEPSGIAWFSPQGAPPTNLWDAPAMVFIGGLSGTLPSEVESRAKAWIRHGRFGEVRYYNPCSDAMAVVEGTKHAFDFFDQRVSRESGR